MLNKWPILVYQMLWSVTILRTMLLLINPLETSYIVEGIKEKVVSPRKNTSCKWTKLFWAWYAPKQAQSLMLKLILSSLQLLPLRPLSPLCQVPTLLLTPLMLSLLQMKTRCRRIEKKTAVSCLFILSGTAQSPKLSLIPSSLKLLPILLRLLPQLPVASCPCCQVPLSSMLAMKSPLNTGLTTLKSSLSPLRLHCHRRHQDDL